MQKIASEHSLNKEIMNQKTIYFESLLGLKPNGTKTYAKEFSCQNQKNLKGDIDLTNLYLNMERTPRNEISQPRHGPFHSDI